MTTNSLTVARMTGGVLDSPALARLTGVVANARREAGRWPWPLPAGSVLAALDNRGDVLGLTDDLIEAGVDPSGISMVSGPGGARRIREGFAGRGLLSRLSGLVNDEGELVEQLEVWCARGAALVLVGTEADRMDAVAAACSRHGAHILRRTGRWTFSGSAACPPALTQAT